jgi:hypothetical protein
MKPYPQLITEMTITELGEVRIVVGDIDGFSIPRAKSLSL